MLKLSTMRALTDTLDDEWESPIADQILARWEHDQERARFFRASANFLFVFHRAGARRFLRFNHSTERSLEGVLAEVNYVNHLRSKGPVVAKPVPSVAGQLVESVPTSQGLFHAVVFEGLEGMQFEIEGLTPQLFMRWGKALGELHAASQGYPVAGRPTWQDHFALAAEYLPASEGTARSALSALRERLARLPINESNYGLIHFDFELDNIVWDGDRAGIIDLDDSASYWFVADIAFALRDLFDDSAGKVDLRDASLQSFLSGYRLAREITREDLELIPTFLRFHNLLSFAKLYRTLGAGEAPDEPVWLQELRKKLALKMQFYRDEFSQRIH